MARTVDPLALSRSAVGLSRNTLSLLSSLGPRGNHPLFSPDTMGLIGQAGQGLGALGSGLGIASLLASDRPDSQKAFGSLLQGASGASSLANLAGYAVPSALSYGLPLAGLAYGLATSDGSEAAQASNASQLAGTLGASITTALGAGPWGGVAAIPGLIGPLLSGRKPPSIDYHWLASRPLIGESLASGQTPNALTAWGALKNQGLSGAASALGTDPDTLVQSTLLSPASDQFSPYQPATMVNPSRFHRGDMRMRPSEDPLERLFNPQTLPMYLPLSGGGYALDEGASNTAPAARDVFRTNVLALANYEAQKQDLLDRGFTDWQTQFFVDKPTITPGFELPRVNGDVYHIGYTPQPSNLTAAPADWMAEPLNQDPIAWAYQNAP